MRGQGQGHAHRDKAVNPVPVSVRKSDEKMKKHGVTDRDTGSPGDEVAEEESDEDAGFSDEDADAAAL